MRRRGIHRVYKMIACHYRGKVTLLKGEDFRDWRKILMRDLSDLESAEFGKASAMGLGRDSLKLRWWERKFSRRLDFIDWTKLRDETHRLYATEAQEYVDDFLEVYRYRHPYMLSTSTEFVTLEVPEDPCETPEDVDELIKLTLHARRTPLDWALGRLGAPIDEISIYKPAIVALHGLSDDFHLYVGDSCYHFGQSGIYELEDFESFSDQVDDDNTCDDE